MSEKTFSAEQVDSLLEKLSTDDEFREQFLGNPGVVLASLGVPVDHSQIPAVRSLPSKEQIKANKEALKAKLTGRAGLPLFLI